MRNFNLNTWAESDLKRAFRALVLALAACRVLMYFMPYGPFQNWATGEVVWFSAAQANVRLVRLEYSSTGGFWGTDVPVQAILWIFELVTLVGLLLMHAWSRSLYVVMLLAGWMLVLFSGPGISGGAVSVVAWLTGLLEGMVLLLLFTSPIRDIMDQDVPPEEAVTERDHGASSPDT